METLRLLAWLAVLGAVMLLAGTIIAHVQTTVRDIAAGAGPT